MAVTSCRLSVLQPIAACGDISGLLLGETESEVFSSITSEPSSRANDLQHRDIFETVDELARCLDQVLDERPMGIVVAQLKKSLLTRYSVFAICVAIDTSKANICRSS